MVNPGTYKLGPQNGRLTVKIEREGAMKAMGHDLTLEVGDWSAEVTIGDDAASSSITLTAKPASLKITEAKGGAKALSDKDKSDIKKNIDDKILNTSRNPEITFKSKTVSGDDKKARVQGDLTLVGSSQPVTMNLNINDSKVSGSTSFNQSTFGIKPFSAMMGALKVKDNVTVEIEGELS